MSSIDKAVLKALTDAQKAQGDNGPLLALPNKTSVQTYEGFFSHNKRNGKGKLTFDGSD